MKRFATAALVLLLAGTACETPRVATPDDLRVDGVRLTVGQPVRMVIEGSPSGRIFAKGATLFVVSPTEIRSAPDNGVGVATLRTKGNKVFINGKTGVFDKANDTLTFDDGMSITIRDGVPYLRQSGATFPLEMKFESIPTASKRAALLVAVLLVAVAESR